MAVEPIRRSAGGSYRPITDWLHYADHDLDPVCRSSSGSYGPITDTLLGIINILAHPAILHALNPLYGITFLLANKAMALVAMGKSFLR